MVKKKHYFRIIKEESEAQNFIETFQKMKARFPEIQKQAATTSPENVCCKLKLPGIGNKNP